MFLCRNSTNHQMIVIRLSMEHIPLLLFSGVGFSDPTQAQLATQSNHKINKRKTWALRKGSAEQKRGEKQALLFLYATIGTVQRKRRRKRSITAIAIAYDFQSTKTFVFSIADNKLQHTKTFWRNAGGTNATIAQRLALHAGINNECRRHKRNNSTEIGFELQETTTNDFDTGSAWRTRQ